MQAFFPGILAVRNRIMVSIRSSLNTPQVFDVSSALGGGCMGRTELDTLRGLISTHQGRKIPSLICWLCSCSYRLGCCGLSCCLVCCWLTPSWLPSTSPQGLFCRAAPLAQEHSTALVPAEPLSPSVLLLLFWVIPQFGNLCLQLSPYLPFQCKRKTREDAGVPQRIQVFSKMFKLFVMEFRKHFDNVREEAHQITLAL